MPIAKSTTPCSESSGIPDAPPAAAELNLPEGGGLRTLPPLVSLTRMIERNRQFRAWFPAGLRSAEERWRAKTPAEFHLE